MRTKRPASAFAFGERTGVRMISIPSLRKTVSKSRVNADAELRQQVAAAHGLDPKAAELLTGSTLAELEARGGRVEEAARRTPPG